MRVYPYPKVYINRKPNRKGNKERIMRTKRNWLRTTIAMLTLVATVLETGFSSVQAFAAEITTEDGIVVNNDAVEEVPEENLDITVEPDNGGDADFEVLETSEDDAFEETVEETSEELPEEVETFEEAEELREGTLDVSDGGITGSGYDDISVYVNTDELDNRDKFRIEFTGPASASYNPVLNEDLDKTNDGRYDFDSLEGGEFTIRANSSDDVILSYTYNEDGYPTIVVESIPAEKVLTTKTLTSTNGDEIEAISGEGFDSITVKFNTEELSDKASFKFFVESDAAATVNGKDASEGISGLGKDSDQLTVEDLDEESFVAYVVSDNDEIKIKSIVNIDSVEDAVAVITVDNEDTKRVYEYEDDKVKVTATLEKADAIPDDAYFDVTPLTEEEAQKYLDALNEGKDEEEDVLATAENTLLYNIGFYTDETMSEEIEPEEGSVSIAIEFKKDQLTEEIEAEEDEDIVVTHIMEEGSSITTEEVEPQVSVEDQTIDFSLESFSLVAITKIGNRTLNPGDSLSYRDVLKGAVNYGIVANEVELGGHIDSNFATGTLKAGCDTTQGAFTGDKVPGNTVVAKYDTAKGSGWYPYSSDGKSPFSVLTTTDAEKIFKNNSDWRSYVTIDSTHTEQGLKDVVSSLVSGTLSESLKTAQTRNKIKDAVNNNKVIDISKAASGTYVIDIEAKDAGKYFESAESTKIRLNSNQFIVFNIPGTNINLKKFAIEMVDKGLSDYSDTNNSNADIYCQHVVFNMYDAKKVTLDAVFGTFLAPKAEVTIGTTSTGWLVANKFKNGGEWHCVWQEMPREGEVKLNIPVNKKFINGSGRWEDGFNFKIEKMNVDGSAIDRGFAAQIINITGGSSEDATGYFELPVKKESEINWANNGDWSYAGYNKYLGEWYRISEVDAQGREVNNSTNRPRQDVEYNIIDPAKAYGENQDRATEQPAYNNSGYWYVHVFYYLNSTTHDIITVKRTARVNPTTNCYKGLPCEEDGVILFKNRYTPQTVTVQFDGIKKLNSGTADVPDGKFGFTLSKYTGSNQFNEVIQADVANEGSTITFNPITLKPGEGWEDGHNTYYFNIKETRCDAPYTADDTEYVVKVTLFWRNNGRLDKTVQYYKYSPDEEGQHIHQTRAENAAFLFGTTGFEFNNTYNATGETVIYGHKKIENRKFKQGDKFTFTLTPKEVNGVKDNHNGVKTITIEPTEADNFDYDFQFEKLTYTLADAGKSYTYTVSETYISDGHVECITPDQDVVVTVTDNKTGTLKAEHADLAGTKNKRVEIRNKYYNASGKIEFHATKKYASGSELEAGTPFEFILEGDNLAAPVKKIAHGQETVDFGEITFPDVSSAGQTYNYTIREVLPEDATAENHYTDAKGIIYDPNVYKVEVTLTDDGNGKLIPSYKGAFNDDTKETISSVNPVFTNDYDLKETKGNIEGIKELHGKDLERGEFTFTISAYGDTVTAVSNGIVVLPDPQSVKNGIPEDKLEKNQFRFGDITFKKKGTYQFKIEEDKSNPEPDMVYSTDEFIATIVVNDNKAGQLVVTSKTISKVGSEGTNDELKFVNTSYTPGSIPLFAYKDLTGRTLTAGAFKFNLKQGETILQENVPNDATGLVEFDSLKYTYEQVKNEPGQTKNFYYTIEEVIPEGAKSDDNGKTYKLGGYTYDGHKENVTVTVTAGIDENGNGIVNVTADNAQREAPKAVFKNKYEASGDTVIEGVKKLTGRKFTNEDSGKFFAELYYVDGPDDYMIGDRKIEKGDLIEKVPITKDTSLNFFGDNGAEFKFTKLEYTKEGTYKYTVKESQTDTVANVTNSKDYYDVTVSVTDVDGNGKLNVVPNKTKKDIVFINTYGAENSTNFQAKKRVNGKLSPNKLFDFVLKEGEKEIDSAKNGDGGLITFKTLTYTQDDLDQTQKETVKTYTISEKVKSMDGYTLSSEVYTAKAILSLNAQGGIDVRKEYFNAAGQKVEEADVFFDNTYVAEGDVELKARKKLTGKDLEAGKFQFQLFDENGNKVLDATNVAAKAGEYADATFPKIKYTQADLDADASHEIENGKYAKLYTMKEVIPSGATTNDNGKTYKLDGYTYDARIYNVVVTLEDKGNGKIETDWYAFERNSAHLQLSFWEDVWNSVVEFVTGNDIEKNAAFDNEYEAEGALDLRALKTLTGKTLSAGDFTFLLTGKDENGKTLRQEKSNDAAGNVVFDRITYTKPTKAGETYEYTITEPVPDDAEQVDGIWVLDGVKYDPTPYTVSVTVSDNDNGKLTVSAVISGNGKTTSVSGTEVTEGDKVINLCKPEPVDFVNTYDTKPITVVPGGEKELVGRALSDGEFSFTMASAEKNPKAYNETVNNVGTTITFPEIKFEFSDMKNEDGTYADRKEFAYTVKEDIPADADKLPGVTYDDSTYNVVITVTNSKGKLTATVTSNEISVLASKLATFHNVYNANGSVSFEVQKLVQGTDDNTKEFEFVLTDENGKTYTTKCKANETKTIASFDYKLDDLVKHADGTYKTYTYTVKETKVDNDGYKYSTDVYDAVVTVKDIGSGELDVDKVIKKNGEQMFNQDGTPYTGKMIFTNVYEAKGDVVIPGTKEVTGRDLTDGEFTFILEKKDENGNYQQIAETTNAGGKFSFKQEYTQDDIGKTYFYRVTEVEPDDAEKAKLGQSSIKFDKTIYDVEVNVNDNHDGTLEVVKTITNASKNNTTADSCSFINPDVKPNSVHFEVEKTLTGKAIADHMFEFTLTGPDQNQSVWNTGTKAVFDDIEYTLADVGKEYTYTIRETIFDLKNGIKYDDTVYTAKVEVSNNNNKVATKVTLTNNKKEGETTYLDGSVTDIKFTNKYESSTKVPLGGSKELSGFVDGRTTLGTYTFVLADENGNVVKVGDKEQKVTVTPKNATEPTDYHFDELVFTQQDYLDSASNGHKFKYTVYEEIPTIDQRTGNVTYDDGHYDITVELYYDADGLLQARTSSTRNVDPATGLVFTNKYKAEGEEIIDGVKTVTGKRLEDASYEFSLSEKDSDGNETLIEKVKNKGDKFTFKKLQYTQKDIGEHVYVVREIATIDGTTLDPTEYEVKITVGEGKDGKLSVRKETSKIPATGEPSTLGVNDAITFDNLFNAEGSIPLDGEKIMKNQPLKSGDFWFVLKDESGKTLQRVTCGNADLDMKTFTSESAFKFEDLSYTQEDLKASDGSYLDEIKKYYTIEEEVASKAGVTYSREAYVVEVKIVNNKTSKLDVTKRIVAKKNTEYSGDSRTGLINRVKDLFKINGIAKNDDVVFENEYDADCEIDPPVFTKQIFGMKIKRGMFWFNIDSDDGLASMGELEKGYHRHVLNGYSVSGAEWPNPGEIAVDDLKIKYTDLLAFDDVKITPATETEPRKVEKTFVFTATEDMKSSVPGVTNSPAVFKLEFTVYDIEDGKLHITTPDGTGKPKWVQETENALSDEEYKDVFLNIFNQEGSIDLVGVKKLDGRKLTKDDKFEFVLTDDATGKTAKVNNTSDSFGVPSVVAFNASEIDFLNYKWGAFEDENKELKEYDDRGDHTYTVEETYFDQNGIVSDTSKFKITVSVTEAFDADGNPLLDATGKHGKLNVAVTKVEKIISENNKESFDHADGNFFEFKNEFKATGKTELDGIKYLKDQAGNALASPDSMLDQYEFALYSYEDAARTIGKTLVSVAKTSANGSFKLDIPEYTQEVLKDEKGEYADEKTLYYRLVEVKPSSGVWTENNTIFESDGVVYDNTEYDVDVNVKFNGTQKLDVSKTIRKADTGEAITSISYTNIVKEYTTVEGNKYWVDNIKDPSQRPDVTVNLYRRTASGVETKINSYTIVAPDTTYRFATDDKGNKLPTYDSAGRPISYVVEELPITGYLSEKVNYDFYNTAGDILIRKIDADTRAPLSGAVLAIFDGSTEIERWTSGTSAHVIESALTAGKTYTLREITAPEGYGVAEDMTFTVPADGSSITVTMSDPPIIGSVRLTKRDASTRETLAGAEFALYNDAGTRIYATGSAGSYSATTSTSNGVFVTDSAGTLTISDLPYGTYYFVETKAPEGYALSSERLGFTILRSGELVEVTYLNTKATGSVRLRKVGSDGTRSLAGAVFELYAATPRSIGQAASSTIFSDAYFRYGTYRTNSAGELYVGDLPWDDYYFIEVEAPDGYETATDVNGDDLVYTFTINAASADRTIDLGGIVNTPERPPITPPPGPTPTPTPGVLGARVKRGGVVNGVLGVRAKPSSGVLGVRVGPVTGDASNIILWLLLLTACVATIVATIVTGRKKKTATK